MKKYDISYIYETGTGTIMLSINIFKKITYFSDYACWGKLIDVNLPK